MGTKKCKNCGSKVLNEKDILCEKCAYDLHIIRLRDRVLLKNKS